MAKVIVGMSGGVDSSVTAELLKQQGYEVEGVSFSLWEARNRTDHTQCCSLEAQNSAAATSEILGIRHRAVDVRNAFIEMVIDPFVEAYKNGITPNPCILCNKFIKFPFLLKAADEAGAEFIATGHYARVVADRPGSASLQKGLDSRKDQSYVLYVLKQKWLKRLLLPLGGLTKDEVRKVARSLHLPAADRPESQEICFIENNNYSSFIEKLAPETSKPGPIINHGGRVVGTHKGIYSYTIGQRKGLGALSLEPHFVTRIDAVNNQVHVGSREEAMSQKIYVQDINWLMTAGKKEFRAEVKLRSMMKASPAMVTVNEDIATVMFDEPQWAPAPGQSAVFYDGDIVIGGGIISSFRLPLLQDSNMSQA